MKQIDFENIKVFYFDSIEIVKNDILWGLMSCGFMVEAPEERVPVGDYEEEQLERLCKIIPNCDFVVSQNFCRILAKACHETGKTYISWIYDAPQVALYREEVFFDTNFIFHFDQAEIERLKKLGVSKVFYCPLAGNVLRTNGIALTEEYQKRFSADISFVGQLYQKEYLNKFLDKLSDRGKESLSSYLNQVVCRYDQRALRYHGADATLREEMHKIYRKEESLIDDITGEDALLLSPFVAKEERFRILNACSKEFYTKLYTGDVTIAKQIPRLHVEGRVDGETEYYGVNAFSKISINTTIPSIETGVSQRTFDIMAIGGFVLSDPQPDLFQLFEVGKDVEIYQSEEELVDKARYYLSHEKERLQIALSGYKRICEEYNYGTLVAKIFQKTLEYM